jgi:hypothetical protein
MSQENMEVQAAGLHGKRNSAERYCVGDFGGPNALLVAPESG